METRDRQNLEHGACALLPCETVDQSELPMGLHSQCHSSILPSSAWQVIRMAPACLQCLVEFGTNIKIPLLVCPGTKDSLASSFLCSLSP